MDRYINTYGTCTNFWKRMKLKGYLKILRAYKSSKEPLGNIFVSSILITILGIIGSFYFKF